MRAKFTITACLLFFRDAKISLLRQFNIGYCDGEYSVPVGHLDGDETVREAAEREAKEEVRLQLEKKEIFFSSVLHRNEGDERVDFFLYARAWRGELVNREPDKCDDLYWETSFPPPKYNSLCRAGDPGPSGRHPF